MIDLVVQSITTKDMEERLRLKSLKELLSYRDSWDNWMRVNCEQIDQRTSSMNWLDKWRIEDLYKKNRKSRCLKKKRSQRRLLLELKLQTNCSLLTSYQALTYHQMLQINLSNLLKSMFLHRMEIEMFLRASYLKIWRQVSPKLRRYPLKTRLRHRWIRKLKLKKIKLWLKYLKIKKLNL